MTLIVQNDAGSVSGANALITVDYFSTYHGARGVDISAYGTSEIEGAIVAATDYLGQRWKFDGYAISEDTAFPRAECYSNVRASTQPLLVAGIPSAVKKAVAEYAMVRLQGLDYWTDASVSDGRVVQSIREKVDVLETETVYAVPPGAVGRRPAFPMGDNYLRAAGLVLDVNRIVRA